MTDFVALALNVVGAFFAGWSFLACVSHLVGQAVAAQILGKFHIKPMPHLLGFAVGMSMIAGGVTILCA